MGRAARLLCAAAMLSLASAVLAQAAQPGPQPQPQTTEPPDAAELDPSAPLAPLPDLGVDWPDLNARDTTAPAPATAGAAPSENASTTRYTWTLEGLGSLAGAEDLLLAFRKQSALEADRKDPANAAQIGRRSRTDADLLAGLLRSLGYYDAVVEPRTERAAGGLQVILTADPGQQYHFASVELPGLEAAGEDAVKLRKVFGVEAGDPVKGSL